jgi:hypothetical protein
MPHVSAAAEETSLNLVETEQMTAADFPPEAYNLDEQPLEDPFKDPVEEAIPHQVTDDLQKEEPLIDPFKDPEGDLILSKSTDDPPLAISHQASLQGLIELSTSVKEANSSFQLEIHEQANSTLPSNSINNSFESASVEEFETPAQSPFESTNQRQLERLSLEKLLPEQSTRIPAPETLALLKNDQEPRNSTVPEIDTLLLKVAEQNGAIGNKPLFWTDFRAPDVEVERALTPPLVREQSFMEGVSSPTYDTVDVDVAMDSEEWVRSPFIQTSSVKTPIVGTKIPSPLLPDVLVGEQEPSLPRPPSTYQVETSHPLQDPGTQSEGRWLAGKHVSLNS